MIQYDYEYDLINHPYHSEILDAGSGTLQQTFTIPDGISQIKGFRIRLSREGSPGPIEWQIAEAGRDRVLAAGILQPEEIAPVLEQVVGADFTPQSVQPGGIYAIRLRVLEGKAPLDTYWIYGPNTRREQVDEPNARIPYWWYESTDIRLDDVNAPLPLAYAGAGYPDYEGGERYNRDGDHTWSISFRILTDLDTPEEYKEEMFEFVKALTAEPYTEWHPLRDENRLPAEGEIAIDPSWRVVNQFGDTIILQNAVKEIETFLDKVLDVPLTGSPSGKNILLVQQAPENYKTSESFEVCVGQNQITISAGHERGILRAVYWLEDQMLLARAPMLPFGTYRVDPRYAIRMVPGIYPAPSYFMMRQAQIWTPGYLWRLSRAGYNAVYFQASIEDFVENSAIFPELNDEEAPAAIERLRRSVEMGAAYGIDFYWDIKTGYEKKFPEAVYRRLPHLRSFRKFGNFPCTGQEETLQFLRETVANVFSKVEDLKGAILVYDTEGFYSCITHNHKDNCPYCKDFALEDLFHRIYRAIRDGARCRRSDREIILWTYYCDEPWNYQLIQSMPEEAILSATYSQLKELNRFGVRVLTDDYSLCSDAPSDYFLRVQALAKQKGMRLFCKTEDTFGQEFVNTPYTPCLDQHQRRWDRLALESVEGIMTQYIHIGFMPTPCQDLTRQNVFEVTKDGQKRELSAREKLLRAAQINYGKEAAEWVLKAWDAFSTAIRDYYPYTWGVCRYPGPIQSAPGHPFYLDPSRKLPRQWARGYVKDLRWTTIRDRFLLEGTWDYRLISRCFQAMLKHYAEGNDYLLHALAVCCPAYRANLEKDLRISQMQQSQIQTIVHLIAFYNLRDAYWKDSNPIMKEQIILILEAELANAQKALRLAEQDSRLGFSCEGDGNIRGGHFTPATIRAKIKDLQETLNGLYQSEKEGYDK